MKLLKVNCHCWHLNAIIWRIKCWRLVFMKLTPGSVGGLSRWGPFKITSHKFNLFLLAEQNWPLSSPLSLYCHTTTHTNPDPDPVTYFSNTPFIKLALPLDTRYSSRANAMVVFPALDKPVNQMVHPRKVPRRSNFSPRFVLVTLCSCFTTFVDLTTPRLVLGLFKPSSVTSIIRFAN